MMINSFLIAINENNLTIRYGCCAYTDIRTYITRSIINTVEHQFYRKRVATEDISFDIVAETPQAQGKTLSWKNINTQEQE